MIVVVRRVIRVIGLVGNVIACLDTGEINVISPVRKVFSEIIAVRHVTVTTTLHATLKMESAYVRQALEDVCAIDPANMACSVRIVGNYVIVTSMSHVIT